MGKRTDYKALRQGFGLSRGLGEEFIQACERNDVPIEAVHRLVTPKGHGTMDEIAQRILSDWQAEQPKPAPQKADVPGGAPGKGDTITIPKDATAEGLVAEAKAAFEREVIPFTYFNNEALELIRNDLELVKGKTLQVLTHTFGRGWTTKEGRVLQKEQGFDGNAAAFLVWITQTKRTGWSVSIANTDDRLWRDPVDGDLCAPFFYRGGQDRKFSLYSVHGKWGGVGVLVAFRAI